MMPGEFDFSAPPISSSCVAARRSQSASASELRSMAVDLTLTYELLIREPRENAIVH